MKYLVGSALTTLCYCLVLFCMASRYQAGWVVLAEECKINVAHLQKENDPTGGGNGEGNVRPGRKGGGKEGEM